jgi:broad specificity phosphatase PhoE
MPMTLFYLIRHGSNDFVSHRLAGRMPGLHLNEAGRREVELLADGLAGEHLDSIFSSPLERCTETAGAIARKAGLAVQVADEIAEIDFGEWTGRTFADLDSIESWKQWNAFRSGSRVPGGESMMEVQARMTGFIMKLRHDHSGRRIALVGHGDPLRAALIYFLGVPSEFIHRLELSPASASLLALSDWGAQIRCLNVCFGEQRMPATV